jgi:signal transduction histidine kinase/ActR/RegA family two-component response regulator
MHRDARERRVLVHAPIGRDAMLASQVLDRAGIATCICGDLADLRARLEEGAAALLITEEALLPATRAALRTLLDAQPPWSDLPLIVLTPRGAPSAATTVVLQELGNVGLIERPVRIGALVSALRVALRARERQYQIRSLLEAQQAHALELREADRRKDEFLATLAHELRNPLAPVRSALDILRRRQHADPMLERVSGVMERQVDHMVRLVDDLMEVSRITRGKIELRRQPLDLWGIVRSAVEACQAQAEAVRHAIDLDLPEAPVRVEADPVRLAQVFGNLLNNAIKYTPPGGLIQLRGWCEDGEAVVAVRDTGIGIPREMLPRVFDMFTQVEDVRRAGQGGLGIGLTLVRTLVELHGGTITADSSGPDQGSEFRVRLPLLQAAAAADAPAQAQIEPDRLASVRVLVVDDNRDAADSLAQVLRDMGAETRVVYDGAAALREARSFRPAVVLLDLGMPQMDGYEVGRRIRQAPETADVRLVALTGWGHADDRRRSREAGFDEHLVKPTPLSTLRTVLAAAAPTP